VSKALIGDVRAEIALTKHVLHEHPLLHLQKMPELAKLVNTDLSRGFTVPQVSEKHVCPVRPEDRTGGGT